MIPGKIVESRAGEAQLRHRGLEISAPTIDASAMTRRHSLLAALLCACAAPTEPPDDGGNVAMSSSETGDSSDDETTGAAILDVAEHDGPGCAKIDLSFVIDDSIESACDGFRLP